MFKEVKESICMKGMVGDIGVTQGYVKVHFDSQRAIHLKIIKCFVKGQKKFTFVCTSIEVWYNKNKL